MSLVSLPEQTNKQMYSVRLEPVTNGTRPQLDSLESASAVEGGYGAQLAST